MPDNYLDVFQSSRLPIGQPEAPVSMRAIGDIPATRKLLYDNVLRSASTLPPLKNNRHTLSLEDVHYADEDLDQAKYGIAAHKDALLNSKTLYRRLRGTWVLSDNVTGQPLEKRTATVLHVPHMTDAGTFVLRGTDYVFRHQMRLQPGVYTRQKQNGETESHVNALSGQGAPHRIFVDPKNNGFFVTVGQAKIPLMPLMRAFGTTDAELRENWGPEVLQANYPHDHTLGLQKLVNKFVRKADREKPGFSAREGLAEVVSRIELDPEVTKRTLGQPYARMGKDTLLAITKKLLAVAKGEAEVDDRDHLAFQRVLGPEDLAAERVAKDWGGIRRGLLSKASWQGSLKNIPTAALNKQIESLFMTSGLSIQPEEINPLELIDKHTAVTRLGVGSIASTESAPAESRAVQPSHLGFIDGIRAPESNRAGLDLNMARAVRKGNDGKLYAPFVDLKTGKQRYVSSQELADVPVAFPGEMRKPGKYVAAMVAGQLKHVPRDSIRFEMPAFEDAFTHVSNLIPMKSAVAGQRSSMSSRFLMQALPLAKPEAPLVQSGMPGQPDRSFEEEYGRYLGALRSDKAGVIRDVSPDAIDIRYDDGTSERRELYNMFPFARKTSWQQTPTVQPGQRINKGDLLAYSNYTTDSHGVAALGVNARTAFIPWAGSAHEDAKVISESFAKRLTSVHLYHPSLEFEDQHKLGKRPYVSLFPGKYDRKQLETLDDNGAVRPGTVLQFGDPILLAAREKATGQQRVHRKGSPAYADVSLAWDHHDPGEVTDVVFGPKGATVLVRSFHQLQEGDKIASRFGLKGIVSRVLPDDQMPVMPDGQTAEVIENPLGIVSRSNPANIIEAVLGKIASKTGRPYKIQDFDQIENLAQYAQDELRRNGVRAYEHVVDPQTGQKIPGVLTGNSFYMKLQHTSESKAQSRGSGGYTADEEPSKGGATGGKRMALMNSNALLSHGSYGVLQDSSLVRGQRNDDFWLSFMQGHTPPKPRVPMVYQRFINLLKGSGLNVVPEGPGLRLLALTDADVKYLAGDRELKNAETVRFDKNLAPIPGGLFDPGLTGGHNDPGRWSYIALHEPMPSPAFEEPIRRVLGLTEQKLLDVLAGKEPYRSFGTGPRAIHQALDSMNLPKEIASARMAIAGTRKTARDEAIRKLGYLRSMQEQGLHPRDWMLTRVPVLPPRFRPVSIMQDTGNPMVDDANYMYRELFEANKNLGEMSKHVGDSGVGPERMAVYNAFKALTGLTDPVHPKLREKNVKGLLAEVFGSAPKHSLMQHRLLGSTTDLVGRAVIAPDPDLDMDHIGLPENRAWDAYKFFIIRRLRRRGMPMLEAAHNVRDRTPLARKELVQEMDQRPVLVDRAPILHKFGVMAFYPRLVKGDTLRVSTAVIRGFNADMDGNCVSGRTEIAIGMNIEALQATDRGKLWLRKWKRAMLSTRSTLCSKNGITAVIPIGEFPVVGEPSRGRHGELMYDVPPGAQIMTYDHETGRVAWSPITRFTVDRNHPCVRVTTARKRTIEVSDNESLAVFDTESGQLAKRKPVDSIDALIPSVRQEPILGTSFSREIGWWYASLACDGWLRPTMIGYAKLDDAKRQEFVQIAREQICDNFTVREYRDNGRVGKFGDSAKVHLSGGDLRRATFSCYVPRGDGRGALYKKIPDEILTYGSRECLLGVFAGLLDGDASIGWNRVLKNPRPICRTNTSSKSLVASCRRLGRLLGVRCGVVICPAKGESRESYAVCWNLTDIRRLAPELHLVGEDGKAWLEQLRRQSESNDNIDIVPVTRVVARWLVLLGRQKDGESLGTLLYGAVRTDHMSRETARRCICLAVDEENKPDGWDGFCRIVGNESIHWDRVNRVEPIESQDVYDLEVPETKVFMLQNGLVVWDTMTYHVPVTDKAVQEAVDRMLPSRNLLSPADFKTPMHMPTQEYVGGLYSATSPPHPGKPGRPNRTHRFVDAASAVAAYRRGEIPINAPVEITQLQ